MIQGVEDLENRLSAPSTVLVQAMETVPGDVLILGAGGKMGPTLARMARRAALDNRRIIAVSRFRDEAAEASLRAHGVETIRQDLLDFAQLAKLPDAPNVVVMSGMKFGSTGDPALTWATNVLLPARIAERFAGSRIMAFSTGNVYGLTPIARGGSREDDPLLPVGEYAMTALGRERVLIHATRTHRSPLALVRLNYACEMRYGVLADVARRVWSGQPINVTMGHFNALWQGDAGAMSLACLAHAGETPLILNVAGPELLSVRHVAEQFGAMLGRSPLIEGHEASEAILSNSQRCVRLMGYPRVGVNQMMEWIADWVRGGGGDFGKPTHYENRSGTY